MTNETITNQTNQAQTAQQIDMTAILARLEALESANKTLASNLAEKTAALDAIAKAERERKHKAIEASVKRFKSEPLGFKVSPKGCLQVSNIGPGSYGGITLYRWAWEKLLANTAQIQAQLAKNPGLITLEGYIEREGVENVAKEFDPTTSPAEKAQGIIHKVA